MTKNRTKIVSRKQFTAQERDDRMLHFADEAYRCMHINFHTGSPDNGLLIGRAVLPILAKQIHRTMVDRSHSGQSLSQILEDLLSQGIVDECTHVSLRRAAAAVGEFGSGRDLHDVMAACDVLRRITKSAAFKDAAEVRRLAKARKATDRRPALIRWASAAAGLFSVGASS
ncbi:hypothetical protein Enr13x_28080 [Stieleria neptunia]|uniref:Uncharacterized protein n=1 Tax=Stieleria neptunia TaxID=2527979 RepID=A0A518HQ29_9BACT|nr:hypothetical protein [Stieleria neptunia]QDV42956.1 hypothetical protein Enr13x_28080 [Stieleria neptunia]